MHKSTIFFGGICLLLAFVVGAVVSKIIQESHITLPLSGGSSVVLGLPGEALPEQTGIFSASSALLFNADTQTILFQQNAFERRPLASITKLMTAMVALDHGILWDKEANILPQEYGVGGELLLHPGETVNMRDLFTASLLGSANNATRAYVRQLNMTEKEFVQAMNRKAIELKLEQTEFHDVTGLDPKNISTAYEVAILANYAFTHYPDIAKATSQREYSFTVRGSGREHTIHNTNKPVRDGEMEVMGTKTGFLYEAGYCLVVQGTGKQSGKVAVIMNDISENAQFAEIRRLLTMQVK
jgi:D-alanyl-D-alanine endopeptidase (penicillin-binding protein 7)